MYDTEFAYGLYGREASDDNIAAALSDSSKEWPNQHGSTLLFRSLLANEDFYDAFISRMLDLLNEEFSSQALTAQADIMADYYTGLIQENRDAGNWFDRYENNLSIVKNYLRKRPAYLYTLLFQHFELGARYTLILILRRAHLPSGRSRRRRAQTASGIMVFMATITAATR